VDSLADLPGIAGTARRAGLDVETSVDAPEDLPLGAQATACAVVREALANAARHAGATRALVSVTATEARVRVDVRDSGPSAGWRPHPGTGNGLAVLRERVGLHGGTLTTGPFEDGFRVTADIPLEDAR